MNVAYKTVQVTNAPERRNRSGGWCKSYEIGDTIYYTRSGSIWGGILGRIRKMKWYKDSGNLFKSFDQFSEWCQSEPGFLEKDSNGRYWSLDKDILVLGNRDYSPTTCCFVPQKINNLFLSSSSCRGDWPIGASYDKSRGKFQSYITMENIRKPLGRYETAEEAHQAWQRMKILQVDSVIKEYPHLRKDMIESLKLRKDMISEDIVNSRETTFIYAKINNGSKNEDTRDRQTSNVRS